MKEQIQLFNLPFRIYDEQQLFQDSCDWLEEPVLHTVFFVTAGQCRQLSEAKGLTEKKEQIVWIPGDDAVRSLFPKKGRRDVPQCSVWQYVLMLCEYAADRGLDICILMETERELETVTEEIRRDYPYLSIHGLHIDAAYSWEMMINEINSIAPDILIAGMHTGSLRHYVEHDRRRTNTRLCVCAGSLLLEEMSKKNRLFHTITMGRKLKKQLHKYNSKEQETNGRDEK